MIRVFSYGTLKTGQPNYRYFTDKKGVFHYAGAAVTVERWPLVVASQYNIPFLLHAKGKGKHVHGEVFEVDEEKLKVLDQLEGFPHFYQKEDIEIRLVKDNVGQDIPGNHTFTCSTYILDDYLPKLLSLPCLENYSAASSGISAYVPPELRNSKVSPALEVKKVDDSS